jgi:hypothetical protein
VVYDPKIHKSGQSTGATRAADMASDERAVAEAIKNRACVSYTAPMLAPWISFLLLIVVGWIGIEAQVVEVEASVDGGASFAVRMT